MQHLQKLPANISSLSPVIVSSPTPRSGTTLLQRLLCSSDNGIVYGEYCGLDFRSSLHAFLKHLRHYQKNHVQFDSRLKQYKQGVVNDWILDFMPELDGYLTEYARGCFTGLEYCAEQAQVFGKSVWGFKNPGFSSETLSALSVMMPNFKLLYIYRDVFECVRSAKSLHLITSLDDLKIYAQIWVRNLLFVRKFLKHEHMLLLNYRDLIEQPTDTLKHISSFTGMTNMDKTVLDVRVNTARDAKNPEGYVSPTALTEEEHELVMKLSAPVRLHLYK